MSLQPNLYLTVFISKQSTNRLARNWFFFCCCCFWGVNQKKSLILGFWFVLLRFIKLLLWVVFSPAALRHTILPGPKRISGRVNIMSWPGVTPVTDSLMWWMPRQKECVQRGEVNTGSASATSRSEGAGARKMVRTKEEERGKVRLTQLNARLRLPLTQLGVVFWPINLRQKTLFGVIYLNLCWAPIKNRQICHLGRWLK